MNTINNRHVGKKKYAIIRAVKLSQRQLRQSKDMTLDKEILARKSSYSPSTNSFMLFLFFLFGSVFVGIVVRGCN
jgi:hypothetical protein